MIFTFYFISQNKVSFAGSYRNLNIVISLLMRKIYAN
ncbi:hypothetical protein BC748_2962 [Flavobacterium dankookense]|uniref:Uncharacterized protein n=1 Tax=Flavobacterium dankookense TaxID=706186 RepID=A0A4V3CRM7_9FLAO|nr:hypothetical protein BC748_2962 [Flavobacterium dankookense]